MRKLSILILFLLFPIFAWANNSQDLIDKYLKKYTRYEHITSVAVTTQCNALSTPVSVYAGKNLSSKENSLFQMGSIAKSFTAVVLLQIEAESHNRFSIEDDMQKWFPEYPQWYGIKIKQLMNMTSGIPDYTKDQNFIHEYYSNPHRYRNLDEILTYVASKNLLFYPGRGWFYSNTNYILLGKLIQKLTGNPSGLEISKRIIEKLNLKNTYFIEDHPNAKIYPNVVHGYLLHQGDHKLYDVTDFSLSWANASGAMMASTEDVNTYIRNLFSPGKLLNTHQLKELTSLVSQKTGTPISKPTKYNPKTYGLGIAASYSDTFGMNYSYEGITLGFRFLYVYVPEKNISVTAALNSSTRNREWELLWGLLNNCCSHNS